MQIVKKLKGHSGSNINLVKIKNDYFVHKSNIKDVGKIITINNHLKINNFKVPNIIEYGDDFILMEYINGIDMFNFLSSEGHNSIAKISKFIEIYYEKTISNKSFDFEPIIIKKINEICKFNKYLNEIINIDKLMEKIPKNMPQAIIHGDFTLDNIIYKEGHFYLIDINPTNLNSVYFDLNKLLQDIDCYWFLRNRNNILNIKLLCQQISKLLKTKYDFLNNKYILIFMLMRILPYCKDSLSINFIYNNIKRIWLS